MYKPLFIYGLLLAFPMQTLADTISPEDFHRSVYALHQQQIAHHDIRKVEEENEYKGASGKGYRYVDTRYFDAASGRLLSHVRRDASKPEHIHIVEVNIYDKDKLVRDFGSVSLPWSPQHPINTMINLHQYNGDLHSFRQYDFFGEVEYEFCEGKLAGETVSISLYEGDINATNTSTTTYKNCFDGTNKDWAQYKIPH